MLDSLKIDSVIAQLVGIQYCIAGNIGRNSNLAQWQVFDETTKFKPTIDYNTLSHYGDAPVNLPISILLNFWTILTTFPAIIITEVSSYMYMYTCMCMHNVHLL